VKNDEVKNDEVKVTGATSGRRQAQLQDDDSQ
jgi:hypothetical protein